MMVKKKKVWLGIILPELNKYEIILLLLSLIVAHALKEQQMSHFIFVRHVMSMMPCLMTVFLNQATVDKLKKKKKKPFGFDR